MERVVYNPQKVRLETIDVDFMNTNTTWFDNCVKPGDIKMITDLDGNLIISTFDWDYPVMVYNVSRALIHYDQKRAKDLYRQVMR